MKYFIDTNIVVDCLNGDIQLVQRFNHIDSVFISCVSIGELYLGAFLSTNLEKESEKISNLINEYCQIIEIDILIAISYAQLKSKLWKAGKLKSDNDIRIASTAMEHDLVLITRDNALLDMDCLKTEKW